MKWLQVSRIRRNIPLFIETTHRNILFLYNIDKSGRLSNEELVTLRELGISKVAQARLFYEILIKKRDGFSILLEALKETRQNYAYNVFLNKKQSEVDTVSYFLQTSLEKENLSHVRHYFPFPNQLISCSYLSYFELESRGILKGVDASFLYAELNRRDDPALSKFQYKMMINKRHDTNGLIKLLEETSQTGSLHILKSGNIFVETQSVKENLPVKTTENTFETCNTIDEFYDTSLSRNTEATGHEGSSIVYIGTFKKTSIVVKKIQSRSSKFCQNVLKNWEDIQKTNERGNLHIVKLYWGAELVKGNEKTYYTATELPVCDLQNRIMLLNVKKNNYYNRERKKLTRFIHEAAMGLEWLHNTYQINHGNINPESVLIFCERTGKEIAKLGHFRGSTKLPEITDSSRTANNWVSPDCLTGTSQNNFAQDIVCLGMTVCYTFSMGKRTNLSKQFNNEIQRNIVDKETRPISFTYRDFAEYHAFTWMMSENPESSPNITQVVYHPSFWDWEMSIQFLIDVARCFDDITLNSLSQKIDEDYESWTAGISQKVKWTSNISDGDLKVLFHFKTYRSELIMKLVQLIRDKFMHYKGLKPIEDRDKNMFWENDIFSDKKFSNYFLDKFPHLVIYLFCTLAKENHTSLAELNKEYF